MEHRANSHCSNSSNSHNQRQSQRRSTNMTLPTPPQHRPPLAYRYKPSARPLRSRLDAFPNTSTNTNNRQHPASPSSSRSLGSFEHRQGRYKEDSPHALVTQVSYYSELQSPPKRKTDGPIPPEAFQQQPAEINGRYQRRPSLPALHESQKQQPPTTSRLQQKHHHHLQHEVMIEVSPGVEVRLRGAHETSQALQDGFVKPCHCICCSSAFYCIYDADYVICPTCRIVSCVNPDQILFFDESNNSITTRGGVGLGFKL